MSAPKIPWKTDVIFRGSLEIHSQNTVTEKKGQSWKQMLCSELLWIWGMLYLVWINKMISLGHNNSPGTSDPYPSPKEDKNHRILELD